MANSRTPRIDRLEPNIIINGAMELAQRGTSALLSNAYTLDRFYVDNQNVGMTTLIDRSSSAPSGEVFANSLRVYNTTTGSLGADSEVNVRYRVEGYDTQRIWKNASTLSFWARSSVAATYWVALHNDGATHSYVRSYDLEADTWTFITMALPALNTVPGSLDRANGIGLEIVWSIVDGDDFKTPTTSSWHAGDFNRGSGASNSAWLTSGNEFLLTGVMLTPGNFEGVGDLPFVRAGKNFMEEKNLTYRYFYRAGNPSSLWRGFNPGQAIDSNTVQFNFHFLVPFRDVPAFSVSSSSALNIASASAAGANSTNIVQNSSTTVDGISMTADRSGGGLAAGNAAQLYVNSGEYIDFDAEL